MQKLVLKEGDVSDQGLQAAYNKLELGGELYVQEAKLEEVRVKLLLSGFVRSVQDEQRGVRAWKPLYAKGTSISFEEREESLRKEAEWRKALENAENDELVEERELEKLPSGERENCEPVVGKRMPCKNCTCGLKEEMEAELAGPESDVRQSRSVTVDDMQKASACGNCALGDAFRCAGCPYLGMAPFKEGEKVMIPELLTMGDL